MQILMEFQKKNQIYIPANADTTFSLDFLKKACNHDAGSYLMCENSLLASNLIFIWHKVTKSNFFLNWLQFGLVMQLSGSESELQSICTGHSRLQRPFLGNWSWKTKHNCCLFTSLSNSKQTHEMRGNRQPHICRGFPGKKGGNPSGYTELNRILLPCK